MTRDDDRIAQLYRDALVEAVNTANGGRTRCLFCGGDLYSYYGRRKPEAGHKESCPVAVLVANELLLPDLR